MKSSENRVACVSILWENNGLAPAATFASGPRDCRICHLGPGHLLKILEPAHDRPGQGRDECEVRSLKFEMRRRSGRLRVIVRTSQFFLLTSNLTNLYDAPMPTPLGHGLAGVATGWAVAGVARENRRALVTQMAILAGLAMAADLDLLFGAHSGPTHSLGAAAIAGIVAAIARWPIARTRLTIGLAAFLAWATHPLMDALAPDTSAPYGVMAFWPFSTNYYLTGLSVFMPIWRYPISARAITHDILAVAREILILTPFTYMVWKVGKSVEVGKSTEVGESEGRRTSGGRNVDGGRKVSEPHNRKS